MAIADTVIRTVFPMTKTGQDVSALGAARSILSARAGLMKWGVAVNQIAEMIPNILVRHCCLFFPTSDLSSEITAEFTAQRPVPK